MIKLLLIDDEIWTRNTIKAFGEWDKHGITIIGEANDGIEGIHLIKEKSPEIVITDMNMPGMNGVDLLKVLKEDYPQIKVIVVSGYGDFNYTKQAIKSNVVDYILKPLDGEELNVVLEKCINEIQLSNSKKNNTVYNLAKSLDKDIITLIMDEKKIIQRLFVEGNVTGIKNTLKRLQNNIIKHKIDHMGVGKFLYKIFSEVIQEQLIRIGHSIEDEKDEQSRFQYIDVEKTTLTEYFNLIEEMLEEAVKEIGASINSKDCNTLIQVKRYIELHYTEPISLEVLASLFFVSKEYLSKAFKVKFKKNLMNYVIELRMEKAKAMIEDKNIRIKTVSETVGYEDVSHFYRVFKNYFGMSPGQMRDGN